MQKLVVLNTVARTLLPTVFDDLTLWRIFMLLFSIRGRGGHWLASTLFLIPALSNASATNQADVQLQADINTMFVQVNQRAPLPPGGCVAGYAWHTTYGGCRRAQTQSELGRCPPGFIGTKVRYRMAFALQANAHDVAYDAWGAWHDSCRPARLAGVIDSLVASVRGGENGDWFDRKTLGGNLRNQMQISYATKYGVTIHRPTATLNCVYSSGTSSSGGESGWELWSGVLLPPGQSLQKGHIGHCQLTNAGKAAELRGSCNSTTGGDGDSCMAGVAKVRITAADQCTVHTETRYTPGGVHHESFNLCR